MISEINLQNFRSYKTAEFKFNSGVNIIVGPNASGKTNLLEAILVACIGRSYRASDRDLISFNKDSARIKMLTNKNDTRIVLLDSLNVSKKSYKINDKLFTRLSPQNKIPVVLFEPNNLSMLSGPADLRRQFLDDLLEQTNPGYGVLRKAYRRTLAQRNALLKRPNIQKHDQLFAWDIRLCDQAEQIVKFRDVISREINDEIEAVYKSLSGSGVRVSFSYVPLAPINGYASSLLQKLEANVVHDQERGFTAYGPHREDIELLIDTHPLQVSASRGEVRSMVLALKIIEATLLEKEFEVKPILLFDDVFSELDENRRSKLTNLLKASQAFITTTDADLVIKRLSKKQQSNLITILTANR